MINKTNTSYEKIFEVLNKILKTLNIDNKFKNKYFMSGFEWGLRKAIKLKYPKTILEGCYFHFIKALWEKSKRLGICNKKTIIDSKIIIFGFKIYPFIKEKERGKYLEEIKDIILKIINKKEKYLKLY